MNTLPLHIVHVVRQFAPSVGGLEAVVLRLASEQRQRLGHTVRVVTLDRQFTAPGRRLAVDDVVDGVPVKRLAWWGSSRYPLCPQVVAHLRGADLVHVHAIDFFFDWLSATRWLHRIPMIASTHGGFFHTAFASTLKRIWFRSVTRTSAIGYRRLVATSDNDGQVFRTIAGDRVEVIENGAEIERFRNAASPRHVQTMVYFGRWSSNKGLEELVALLAAMRCQDPRWRLLIAGRPFDLTRARLSESLARHGVADAVELHESPSDDDLKALMTRASYFACLSRHEGFGIAAIEGLSAGLIPILSDIPPFRKIVEQLRQGLLLPLDRTASLNAVEVLRLDTEVSGGPDQRAARVEFTRRYDWSRVVDRYETTYRAVLADGGERVRSAGA